MKLKSVWTEEDIKFVQLMKELGWSVDRIKDEEGYAKESVRIIFSGKAKKIQSLIGLRRVLTTTEKRQIIDDMISTNLSIRSFCDEQGYEPTSVTKWFKQFKDAEYRTNYMNNAIKKDCKRKPKMIDGQIKLISQKDAPYQWINQHKKNNPMCMKWT